MSHAFAATISMAYTDLTSVCWPESTLAENWNIAIHYRLCKWLFTGYTTHHTQQKDLHFPWKHWKHFDVVLGEDFKEYMKTISLFWTIFLRDRMWTFVHFTTQLWSTRKMITQVKCSFSVNWKPLHGWNLMTWTTRFMTFWSKQHLHSIHSLSLEINHLTCSLTKTSAVENRAREKRYQNNITTLLCLASICPKAL